MDQYLIYNFSGEIDDLSHLFPNERLAQIAAIIQTGGGQATIRDRGNVRSLSELAPPKWKRSIAAWAGKPLFAKLSRNQKITKFEKLFYGLPLKQVSESMTHDLDRNYVHFMAREATQIAAEGYKAIFLNLWQGGFDESMFLAESIKGLADIPIYAIGQRVDWFQEAILEHYPALDGIILGLGYDTIRRMVSGEPFESLSNVAWRNDADEVVSAERCIVEVTDLPRPTYDPAVYENMEELLPLIHISLSNQACPNRCAFCPRPANYGYDIRRKPVEEVVDEVEELVNQGYRYFRLADSTPPPGILTDFARGIVERGLHEKGVQFTAFSRVDQNREEDFALLRKAQFRSLFFGLESLDDIGLERIRKGFTYQDAKDTLERIHEHGFFVVGSLIFPLPNETEESRETTLNRLREISPMLDSILIQPAGVYPTSDWGKTPDEFGILVDEEYVSKLMNYPVKFIVPMRFWPPFPFSYPLMGKPAEEVTFDDIRVVYEDFSRMVWEELGICNVQDYTLLVASMLGDDPYKFTDRVKEVLVTRNYAAIGDIVSRARQHLSG
jgi:Radical SAM superfamily